LAVEESCSFVNPVLFNCAPVSVAPARLEKVVKWISSG